MKITFATQGDCFHCIKLAKEQKEVQILAADHDTLEIDI